MQSVTDQRLLQQFREALQRGAQPVASDPAAARVIAEATAESRRQVDEYWMPQPQIEKATNSTSLEEIDEFLKVARPVGFPHIQPIVELGGRFKADRPSCRMERHQYARWLEHFEATARRLGYAKK